MAGEGQGDAEGLSFRLLEEIVDDSFTGTHEALLGKPIGALLLRHADGVYRGAGRMVAAHGKYVADPSLSVEIEDGTVRGSFDNIPFGSRTARSDEAEHLGLWARLIYRQDKPGTSPRFIDVVPAVPPGVAVSVVHPIPAPSLEVAVVEPVTPPPTPDETAFNEVKALMESAKTPADLIAASDIARAVAFPKEQRDALGVFYKDADPLLINDMITANLLFKSEKIVHRFPYHDRCDTLLIQRAQQSWFIDVNSLKPRMTELNERINWIPEHLKHGRFGQNIQQQPDWCISRNRYWATPMPVWESEDGDRIVVSSVKEIEELSGQKVEDLHRPYIDKIVIKKDGKEYKRRLEVLDSWLEAGSMPWAQIHYPFENKEKFETNYPGDYIVEYIAQVRAWFNVMHILSTAVFDSNSFKNVISTGVMAGSDGRKMSKTFNNYTDPRQVLQDYGGDALRLYLMGSPLMIGDNANFEESELRTKLRNVLNPLWNSLKYFQMYAAVFNWKNSEVTKPEHILDTWITARLHEVIKTISTGMEEYRVPVAVRAVEEFVDDLSRWYVRRSRDRISAGDKGALSTLYTVLFEFSRASAPVIPFMSENIYRILRVFSVGDTPESVHLEQFPGYDNDFILSNQGLLENMKKVRDLVSYGLSIRSEKKISVRQPLSSVAASGVDKVPQELSVLILDELNVKEIQYVTEVPAAYASVSFNNINVGLDTNITDELKYEGLSRDFVRKIQEMRKEAGLKVGDIIEITYPSDPDTAKVIELYGEEISKKIQASNLTAGPDFTVRKVN